MLRSLLTSTTAELVTDDALRERAFAETDLVAEVRAGDVWTKCVAVRRLLVLQAQDQDLRRAARTVPVVVGEVQSVDAAASGAGQLEFIRLALIYISRCAELLLNSNDGGTADLRTALLLAVNALQRAASHRSHIVRGWALRTLAGLRSAEGAAALAASLQRAASDGSPYVRVQTAATALRLVLDNPEFFAAALDAVFVRLLTDGETTVASTAIFCLNFVFDKFPDLGAGAAVSPLPAAVAERFGLPASPRPLLTLLDPFCAKLTEGLAGLTPAGQAACLALLTRYYRSFTSGRGSDDLDDFVQRALELARLCHAQDGVFVAAVTALTRLGREDLVLAQLVPAMLNFYACGGGADGVADGGATAGVLALCEYFATRYPEKFAAEAEIFHVKFTDSAEARQAKINILLTLAPCPDFPWEGAVTHLIDAARWPSEGAAPAEPAASFAVLAELAERRPEAINAVLKELVDCVVLPNRASALEAALVNLTRLAARAPQLGSAARVLQRLSERLAVDLAQAERAQRRGFSEGEVPAAFVRGFPTNRSRAAVLDVLRIFGRGTNSSDGADLATELCRACITGNPRFQSAQVVASVLWLAAEKLAAFQSAKVADQSRVQALANAFATFLRRVVERSTARAEQGISDPALLSAHRKGDPLGEPSNRGSATAAFDPASAVARLLLILSQGDAKYFLSAEGMADLDACFAKKGSAAEGVAAAPAATPATAPVRPLVEDRLPPFLSSDGASEEGPGAGRVERTDEQRRAQVKLRRATAPEASEKEDDRLRLLKDAELFYATADSLAGGQRGIVMLGEVDDEDEEDRRADESAANGTVGGSARGSGALGGGASSDDDADWHWIQQSSSMAKTTG